MLHAERLRPHYVLTLEAWIARLTANRDAAIAATSEDLYGTFLAYLEGAARWYRSGETNLYQFLFGVA